MRPGRPVPPVWLMGLSNSTVGLTTGIVFFVMPQLLSAQRVPEATIAGITAAAMSPNFWAVVFSPVLDVRFSRRWYATVFAAVTSVLVFVAVTNLQHLLVLEIALVLAIATAGLSTAALGGWLSVVCRHEEKNKLSAWANVALICGIGVAALTGGELVRHLPVWIAAALMGLLVFLPVSIFPFMPAPGPDRRLAGESFSQFNREVLALLRRREVLIALLIFVCPCSSFALTNILGGLGSDFHASARMVSFAGGAGAFFPGLAGCLVFPFVAKRLPLRLLYLANGMVGGLFTLSLIVLPHAPWSFVLALLGEFLFQAGAYCIQLGIVFETIGQNNPLAATTFAFLTAATNIPVTYMMVADGRGYSMGGAVGSFATDAGIGIASCLLLGLLLSRLPGNGYSAKTPEIEALEALPQEE
ncbi:MAG TPA: MFS transporter [Terracidiphilus sp.]|nr:MFS transporter [Terracidiphilus sp.]